MMFRHARKYLVLFLIVGAAQVAGCVGAEEEVAESEVAPEVAICDQDGTAPAEPAASGAGKQDAGASCLERFEFPLEAGHEHGLAREPEVSEFSSYDLYFHPNNGLHGGWIEAWRLCNQGGQKYVICAGGYAPVRYWNPSSCNGTVHDYYPQGWHGWAQTGGGCG